MSTLVTFTRVRLSPEWVQPDIKRIVARTSAPGRGIAEYGDRALNNRIGFNAMVKFIRIEPISVMITSYTIVMLTFTILNNHNAFSERRALPVYRWL
jgi:hypothetical protein